MYYIYKGIGQSVMFTKEKIIEIINESGQYIDGFMLDAFIKNWKIEAIYEDENGIEFFDEDAVEKIKSGITPNNSHQPEVEHQEIEPEAQDNRQDTNENISSEVQVSYEQISNEPKVLNNEIVPTTNVSKQEIQQTHRENEVKNVTLDITNQTLGVLAEAIAGRITTDIAKFIKDTDFIQQAIDAGSFKKDNEVLAQKLQELVKDNRLMAQKLQEFENQKSENFIKVFGNIYVKKN